MRWEKADKTEWPGFTEHDFKICELCGALNLAVTDECVVCSWHGRFGYDPDSVKKAMQELRQASRDLGDTFFSEDVSLEEYLRPARRPNRLVTWVRRVLGFDGQN
jgi:hypothetical protein